MGQEITLQHNSRERLKDNRLKTIWRNKIMAMGMRSLANGLVINGTSI
jgi:hypothetical protein